MKQLTKLITVLLFVFAITLVAKPALATCDEQYGGVCKEIELRIEKFVKDPTSETFVKNMGVHDYKFGPEEEITFKLIIKNTGDEKFDEVHIKDYLPEYLNHLSGELDFVIHDFDPGEEVKKEFKVKVVPANELPDENSIICVTNAAEAWSGDKKSRDTAGVCLEEKVLGVAELPPTGPENWFVFLGLSITSALIGLFLFHKAKEGSWKIA